MKALAPLAIALLALSCGQPADGTQNPGSTDSTAANAAPENAPAVQATRPPDARIAELAGTYAKLSDDKMPAMKMGLDQTGSVHFYIYHPGDATSENFEGTAAAKDNMLTLDCLKETFTFEVQEDHSLKYTGDRKDIKGFVLAKVQ